MIKLLLHGLPGSGKSTVSAKIFALFKEIIPLNVSYSPEYAKLSLDLGNWDAVYLKDNPDTIFYESVQFLDLQNADILVSETNPFMNLFYNWVHQKEYKNHYEIVDKLGVAILDKLVGGDIIHIVLAKDFNDIHINRGRVHTHEDTLKLNSLFNKHINQLFKKRYPNAKVFYFEKTEALNDDNIKKICRTTLDIIFKLENYSDGGETHD